MRSTLNISAFLLVIFLVLSGCQSRARQQTADVATVHENVAGVQDARMQIDKTLAALNRLMSAQAGQLQPAYDQYSKQVENMKLAAGIAEKQAKGVRGESLDYWAMWQESHNRIANEELRAASDSRRAAVMGRFESIQKSYEAGRAAFAPFMRNLEAIQRVLGNDLTPAGLQKLATTGVVKAANTDGLEMARNLDAMKLQYTALAEALRPSAASETGNPPTASRPFASGKQ